MRKLLSPTLAQLNDQIVAFMCPGCRTTHHLPIAGAGAWGYNGKPEAPTFTPSVLVRWGCKVSGAKLRPDGKCAACEEAKAEGEPSMCGACHSFVTDGQIQFLGDCTHDLAGQTVPLPPLPQWLVDECKETQP
jgi:hypothetical protein